MNTPLRVLILDDSEDDTLLLVRELERGGYAPTFERADTALAMHSALAGQSWDIILSDYSMPAFSGLDALELLHDIGLDLPFIIVSGTINEVMAVDALKAGAHDFVVKGNFARLVPAIERELREAQSRAGRLGGSADPAHQTNCLRRGSI
jgi:DNA-binding NtrC family response regulator